MALILHNRHGMHFVFYLECERKTKTINNQLQTPLPSFLKGMTSEINMEHNSSNSTQAECSYNWLAYAPVDLAQFLYNKEVCGSQGPEEQGNVVCNRARQKPDPV